MKECHLEGDGILITKQGNLAINEWLFRPKRNWAPKNFLFLIFIFHNHYIPKYIHTYTFKDSLCLTLFTRSFLKQIIAPQPETDDWK